MAKEGGRGSRMLERILHFINGEVYLRRSESSVMKQSRVIGLCWSIKVCDVIKNENLKGKILQGLQHGFLDHGECSAGQSREEKCLPGVLVTQEGGNSVWGRTGNLEGKGTLKEQ